MSPDVDFTPAGGSPPRPVPKVGELVRVMKLPDQHDPRLRIGQVGNVRVVSGAMFTIQLAWGVAKLNSTQIDLL